MDVRRTGWLAVLVAVAAGLGTATLNAQEDTLPAGVGYAHPHSGARAAVHVVEFSDFGCAYCAQFATQTFAELEREFVTTGKVRWTFVPFRLVGSPHADEAAEAAECAGAQKMFWPMHDRLFAERARWGAGADFAKIFQAYARELGADTARFQRCTQSRSMRGRVQGNTSVAREMGARSTPTFFVNGRRVEGALPYAQFRAVILREIAAREAKAAPRPGTR